MKKQCCSGAGFSKINFVKLILNKFLSFQPNLLSCKVSLLSDISRFSKLSPRPESVLSETSAGLAPSTWIISSWVKYYHHLSHLGSSIRRWLKVKQLCQRRSPSLQLFHLDLGLIHLVILHSTSLISSSPSESVSAPMASIQEESVEPRSKLLMEVS